MSSGALVRSGLLTIVVVLDANGVRAVASGAPILPAPFDVDNVALHLLATSLAPLV
jgi:hypothetical protein